MNIMKNFPLFIAIIFTQPLIAMNALTKKQADIVKKITAEASSKEMAKGLRTRSLIILFDPNNDEQINISNKDCQPGSLSNKLKQAILLGGSYNENTPIIASYRFYDNLIICSDATDDLKKALDHWKVYTTKDMSLIVLVPSTPDYNDDLISGIKINNLVSIEKRTKNPPPVNDNLAAYLKEILVTRDDLLESETDKYLNRWDIYLNGHGSPKSSHGNNSVAGMLIDKFDTLLDFLNAKINTRSFLYDTCYAGGNLIEPYQYTQEGHKVLENVTEVKSEFRAKDLNYMVISTTTLEAVTFTNQETKFASYFNKLDKFFEKIPKEKTKEDAKTMLKETPFLADAILEVSDWTGSLRDDAINAQSYWLQIPIVRFPHTDKFILAPSKELFWLNDSAIKYAINKGKGSLVIPKEVKIVLLESRYVPIPVEIQGNTMPLFIPKELKSTDYFFKKMSAPKLNIMDCTNKSDKNINDFIGCFEILRRKTKITNIKDLEHVSSLGDFYIDTLEVKINPDDAKKIHEKPDNNKTYYFYNVEIKPRVYNDLFTAVYVLKEQENNTEIKLKVRLNGNTPQSSCHWNVSFETESEYSTGTLKNYKKAKDKIIKESSLPKQMKEESNEQIFERLKNHPLKLYPWLASLETSEIIKEYEKIPKPLAYKYLLPLPTNLSEEEEFKINQFKQWDSTLKHLEENKFQKDALVAYLFKSNNDLKEWKEHQSQYIGEELLNEVIRTINDDKDFIAFARYRELCFKPIELIRWLATLSDEQIKHLESVIGSYETSPESSKRSPGN